MEWPSRGELFFCGEQASVFIFLAGLCAAFNPGLLGGHGQIECLMAGSAGRTQFLSQRAHLQTEERSGVQRPAESPYHHVVSAKATLSSQIKC